MLKPYTLPDESKIDLGTIRRISVLVYAPDHLFSGEHIYGILHKTTIALDMEGLSQPLTIVMSAIQDTSKAWHSQKEDLEKKVLAEGSKAYGRLLTAWIG